ncbi:universal stress protein UspA [Sulfodiicoccus acidiphilus]|uniref:Universal stress protein UspA n=1 Tax=Sulfodiicoccus acidiphilus TaxID=1670455 RepID=A0A348B239_9CREN|nr:universal stress protein [Sulfodiicoccus acidiphilus]BBD72241.1 universal stress protein UspA [Sulfodiicoccus acidiphilus]GGT90850.1 universal stress protein UspA [Sulfodiicoccus acidiphilus]
MFEKVLLAYDGSEEAKKAVEVAVDVAKKYSAKLYVLEVVDNTILYSFAAPPISFKELEKRAESHVNEVAQRARSSGVDCEPKVAAGYPPTAIMEFAESNGVGLIVMGSRGLSTFKKLFLGSVSSAVVNNSKVPVLIVR